VRNAAIGLLIRYTGLRVEEVEALDIGDVVTSAAWRTAQVSADSGM
jgi:hypothetical protein